MTTKQPPAQKHLDAAKKLLKPWFSAIDTILGWEDKDDLIERVAWCIAEIEAEALASKVVTPKDLLLRDKEISDFSEDTTYAYLDGYNACLETVRKNLTLAPNEPEVKAIEVTQVCECEYTREVDANGDQVIVMCNYHNEMGDYYTKGFLEGQASRNIRLPEKKEEQKGYNTGSFVEGWNDCLDQVIAMNKDALK